ncbi:MAG: hypothetical protein LBB74_09600 [Chitinispirillales bacterium]|jgi:hypothetical protein|nr:hypothetical protein [Chitinispirillales bacterium]
MGKCKHFFAAAFIALLPMSVSALSIQLPADEDGLAELLSARSIDTLQYEQLLAFYALPLSVPRGELVYLAQVFPDIADIIPASLEELSAYQPFDNTQIRRFFNDCPALEGFEPILRFNAAAGPAEPNSEVIVGINRSSVDALRGHRIRFRHKGSLLSAEGGLAFGDSAALWQSRRLSLSYMGVNAHIGNFRQPIPGELAMGRFAPLSSLIELTDMKMSVPAANWLYGGSGVWNGVSVDVKEMWGVRMMGASAFCHLRPAETGWGVGADVNVGKRARVFAGFTGFLLGAATDAGEDGGYGSYGDDAAAGYDTGDAGGKSVATSGYYCAHLYAEYTAQSVRAAAEAAVPLVQESFTAALSLRLNYRVKGSSAEYRAIFYPEADAFPMSRLKKQLSTEAGEKEPTPSPIQKHSVKMAVPCINDAVKLTPELDFVESGGVKRIHGQAEARARAGMADIAVKHTAKIFTTGADSVLRVSSVSISYRTPCPLEIRATYQRACGHYKNARNTYALEAPTTLIPSAVITPCIRGKYVSANEYWLGIKGEFHLYKKTWTGVTMEIPVNVKGADNVYVKVSSSYSF